MTGVEAGATAERTGDGFVNGDNACQGSVSDEFEVVKVVSRPEKGVRVEKPDEGVGREVGVSVVPGGHTPWGRKLGGGEEFREVLDSELL